MTPSLRTLLFAILITAGASLTAAPVASIRYPLPAEFATPAATAGTQAYFDGETTLLSQLQVTLTAMGQNESVTGGGNATGKETLLLVKSGQMDIEIAGGLPGAIGPGSIALILPGDDYAVKAGGAETLVYYTMSYRSKSGANADRGRAAGDSFVVDFAELVFQPHDRGGLRNYFNRATTMTENFEMHVTTLNEGITSHPPHTHRAEEIILMIHGEAEELINGEPHALATGDFVFLDSMVPHGIRNTGAGTCMYFAFQWR